MSDMNDNDVPEITIYSSAQCPYCDRAKDLLTRKGVSFKEIRIDLDPLAKDTMIEQTGRRTVPQIYIGALHVGGCDDLYALERSGELDKLLA